MDQIKLNTAIACRCLDRLNARGIKGKVARSKAALEFIIGAASILEVLEDAQHQLGGLAIMVSVRGVEELESIANKAAAAAQAGVG
jgi:hypothetical protein